MSKDESDGELKKQMFRKSIFDDAVLKTEIIMLVDADKILDEAKKECPLPKNLDTYNTDNTVKDFLDCVDWVRKWFGSKP